MTLFATDHETDNSKAVIIDAVVVVVVVGHLIIAGTRHDDTTVSFDTSWPTPLVMNVFSDPFDGLSLQRSLVVYTSTAVVDPLAGRFVRWDSRCPYGGQWCGSIGWIHAALDPPPQASGSDLGRLGFASLVRRASP
jgi:hypothetical protein